MAIIEVRSGNMRVYWDLPVRMREVSGKRRGSLTVRLSEVQSGADLAQKAFDAKEIAEAHEHAITGDRVRAVLDKKWAARYDKSPTFHDWAIRFFAQKDKNEDWADGKTRHSNMWRFENVILPGLGDRPISAITSDEINSFLRALKTDRKIAHATVNHYYDNIAQVINFAHLRGGLLINPLVDKPWNKTPPRSQVDHESVDESEHYFEVDEFYRFYKHLRSDMQLFVRLLLETGMRFNEAGALQVGDLEPAFNLIRIRRAWPGYYPGFKEKDISPGPTKNRKDRAAYITDALLKGLLDHIDGKKKSDFVFVGGQGGPMRNPNFRRDHWNIAMNKVMQCSDHMPTRVDGRNNLLVPDPKKRSTCGCLGEPAFVNFSPHSLRHTCASWLIYLGESIANVSMLLGHGSITTTQANYVHQLRRSKRLGLSPEKIAQMRELMPNLSVNPPA